MAKKEYDEVAKLLMEKHTFKTPEDSDICYVYMNGYYIPASVFIKKEVQRIMESNGDKVNERFVKEVIETIKRKTFIGKYDIETEKYRHAAY